MQYVLFDDSSWQDFFPLTLTRPVSDLRIGIDTISEKWARHLGITPQISARGFLSPFFSNFDPSIDSLLINGRVIPDSEILREIGELEPGQCLLSEKEELLAARINLSPAIAQTLRDDQDLVPFFSALLIPVQSRSSDTLIISKISDLFQENKRCIQRDFEHFAAQGKTQGIQDKHTLVYGKDNIFVEEGVKIRAAILNAEDGPIYIGREAEIQEGAIIHGAHAICAHSTINMGAKMRGDSTIGPWSKVGGEVSNSVVWGYSNKGHDGFMGNSVLGQWCNLGADTNTSNLKNNYTSVRLWNYKNNHFEDTGSIFCGLVMADHAKCGINTMFNTGTVVGVGSNIFGSGYPRNFIPSFSWGGHAGFSTYKLDKVIEVAEIVMQRRKMALSQKEKDLLAIIFEETKKYRKE